MLKRGYIARHTETGRYLVETSGNGLFVTLTRKADNASLFMQNDEAADFLGDVESMWAAYPTIGAARVEETIDHMLSQYDDVLTEGV